MGHETPLTFFPRKFHGHRWGHEKLFCKIHWPWNDVLGIFKWFSWDFHKSQFHSGNAARNNCGTHFGSSPLLVSKVANRLFQRDNWPNFSCHLSDIFLLLIYLQQEASRPKIARLRSKVAQGHWRISTTRHQVFIFSLLWQVCNSMSSEWTNKMLILIETLEPFTILF